MSEPKDSAIKLFGMTIPVAEISTTQDHGHPYCASSSIGESNSKADGDDKEIDKGMVGEKPTENKQENDAPTLISEESSNPEMSDNPTSVSVEKDNTSKPEEGDEEEEEDEEESDSSNSQDKTLKKPDKLLPCPRCNSMDTKFCYFNNYNVNQPRHFCKNCQRYWTAGGTMRNVPVGAGRRKNKNSTSHYRHITVSEAGVHHPSLKTNGTVLTFASDPPLHESMASVLNLADKTMQDCSRNGSRISIASKEEETSKSGAREPAMQNFVGFPPQMPWPYFWNPAQGISQVPPPGFPMPFYPPPPPYWGCSVPGAWNMPWVPQPSSGPNSPTLGKHSREETATKQTDSGEENLVKEKNGDRCLWIPKTLRIDDPGEAAKSSIWTTLGIKKDKTNSVGGRGLFKAFELKSDEQNVTAEAASVLQANPAALSRSVKFHERS